MFYVSDEADTALREIANIPEPSLAAHRSPLRQINGPSESEIQRFGEVLEVSK